MSVGDGRSFYDRVARAIASVGRSPDDTSVSASWSDGREWSVHVTAEGPDLTVSYGPGSMVVTGPDEAAAVVKAIFRGEIVCVTALNNEEPVFFALGRRDDPTAAFNGPRKLPSIDHIMIRSWTGKYDQE